jgi:hypothetical protein
MEHYYENLVGWFDFQDIYSDMVKNADNNSHFVEVGAFLGKSTSFMGVEIINSGKNILFDVVDIFDCEIPGDEETYKKEVVILNNVVENNKKEKEETFYDLFTHNIKPVKYAIGNIHKMFSVEASSLYKDDRLAFVFIDASHKYEDVKKDIQAWLPKVKTNGYIGGHDYHPDWQGVIDAVKEVIGEGNYIVSGNSWLYQKK